ncbi:MAG: hypothetical protein H7A32_01150 [Deltaproteobacteria bacterium]|nr:hypothetical protein [Deltaproteobacteria bacterium]
MSNSVYGNRYHQPQVQRSNNPSQSLNSTQNQAPVEQYISDGELNNSEAPLTQTQKALTDRYQQTREKIGNNLEKFEDKMRSIQNSSHSVDDKLNALDEIESLLAEIESQGTLYNALENNLTRQGLKQDSQDFRSTLKDYKKNIHSYQGNLLEQKDALAKALELEKQKAEEARLAQEAAENERAQQEAAEVAKQQQLENRKNDASHTLRSLVGHLNGSNEIQYHSDEELKRTLAANILNIMANAIQSGDWSQLKNQIDSIEDKKRGESVALVIALIRDRAPQSVIETIPAEVFYDLASGVQNSDNQGDRKISIMSNGDKPLLNAGKTDITLSGYATIAIEMAGQSEAYAANPNPVATEELKTQHEEAKKLILNIR